LKAARQLRAPGSQVAPHDKFQLYDEHDAAENERDGEGVSYRGCAHKNPANSVGRNAPSAANGFGHRCGEPDQTPILFGELEKGINAINAIAPQRIQTW
jgi:hypothetical protein